jgi:glycosyltransferase involved in cell wall biosynthesis
MPEIGRNPNPPLVVHLIPETASAGAERQARYLISGLRERGGWQIELAYFRAGRAHDEFESLGVEMREVRSTRRLALDWRRRVRVLHELYAGREPAIVHAWLDEASLVAALAIRRWPRAKLVVSQRIDRSAYRNAAHWKWTKRAIRGRVDHAISNSEGGIEFLHRLGYSPARTSLIPNGVPDSARRDAPEVELRAAARARLGLRESGPVVGFVGRPDQQKDLGTLFEAMEVVWRSFPAARLILIGPTDQELRDLGLQAPERTNAMGWWRTPLELMPAFDVVAHSSWMEGHSNAVDEALVAGAPVATTSAGDHGKVVARAGGRVVPIRRPDLLGAAIAELLTNPPPRNHVRTNAMRLLSMTPVVDATHDLYSRLLA